MGCEQVRRLDLNLLLAFEALIAERSVTRAAKRMSVGQPAMSASLARLRAFFGDPLLVRAGADAGQVGPGSRLGHGDGGDQRAVGDAGQPAPPLLVGGQPPRGGDRRGLPVGGRGLPVTPVARVSGCAAR